MKPLLPPQLGEARLPQLVLHRLLNRIIHADDDRHSIG